jgi:lipopolysaccharide transport system permease protein
LVNHLIGFAILLVIIAFTIGKISVFILLVPLYFLTLMLFTLGIAWLVSSLNVFVRDISQVLSVILTFWFWFTPIFYTTDRFPPRLLVLVKWNPVAHIVMGYRDCLLRMRMPDLRALGLLALVSLLVFAVGGLFFRHTKREFVDVL